MKPCSSWPSSKASRKPCFSPAALEEYSEVLARPKFAFSPDEISDLIELLYRQGDLVRPAPLSGMSLDPKDDKFMACALAAQQISWSRATIRISRKLDWETQVVSAGELLNLITLEF